MRPLAVRPRSAAGRMAPGLDCPGLPAPSVTGAIVTMISSSSPRPWNCPTKSPPPISQMFLPAAAACMAWWSGATSPRTKRMSARGNDRRDRWQRRVSLRSLSVEYSAPPSRSQVGRGLPACTQCGFPGERVRCRKLSAARRTSPARLRWAKCPQSLSVTRVAWGTASKSNASLPGRGRQVGGERHVGGPCLVIEIGTAVNHDDRPTFPDVSNVE